MRTVTWTLASLFALGGSARAEPEARPSLATDELVGTSGSYRGVSENYLVLPRGGELSASMRFMTARGALGGEPLRFTDLGLFDVAGRWSLFPRLEVAADVTLLPKQPSFSSDKPWQSVAVGVRTPIGERGAIAVSGAGGHLLAHEGMWARQTMGFEWRKPIGDMINLGLTGGVDAIMLAAPHANTAVISEAAVAFTPMVHDPYGHFGGWLGIGYAIPIASRGEDPTTGMAVDPQPRLDFRIGAVVSLLRGWDLYTELVVIDRGDLENRATQLPILDGGFDQQQVVFGITKHVERVRGASRVAADPMQIGMRERHRDEASADR